ncbi:antibiotic biosynthesis monooxygenase [Pseudonocardia thermophila]|uniref:putative quinol monooxygenase n=1 Tax=Pseudonocardia thermophila TaxID=1848 RepID=UPI0011610573
MGRHRSAGGARRSERPTGGTHDLHRHPHRRAPRPARGLLRRHRPLLGPGAREPGNLRFTCYESVEGGDEYVVLADYADQAAGEAHVRSEHAQWFFGRLPAVVARAPRIVHQELPPGWTGWRWPRS